MASLLMGLHAPLMLYMTLFPMIAHASTTRRTSDLDHRQGHVLVDLDQLDPQRPRQARRRLGGGHRRDPQAAPEPGIELVEIEDRKSTRLNSSYRCISYAVFFLTIKTLTTTQPNY